MNILNQVKSRRSNLNGSGSIGNTSNNGSNNSNKLLVDNIIILSEFIRDIVATFSTKHKLENTVDELFGLYSNMLDDYYEVDRTNTSVLEI